MQSAKGYQDLYDYQKDDVEFLLSKAPELNNKPHKILGHEPGLGKTPPTCIALQQVKGRKLIICPAEPLKTMWKDRLAEWGTSESCFIVQTGKDKIPNDVEFVIVNFELILVDAILNQLLAVYWKALVIDEADRLKSVEAKVTTRVFGGKNPIAKHAFHIWLLTGTFMPNYPIDMFPALAALGPELLGVYKVFDKYVVRYCAGWFDTEIREWNTSGASHTDELRERIRPIFRRLENEDVAAKIDLEESFVEVKLDMQETERNTETSKLIPLIGLAKIPAAIELIEELIREYPEEKILVFTYHRAVTEALHVHFQQHGFAKYYGGMSKREKTAALDHFKHNPACHGLVASVRASGVGLDGLQFYCNRFVRVELDWSMGITKQSRGRIARHGQLKKVFATTIIAKGTKEEDMLFNYRQKDTTFKKLFNGTHNKHKGIKLMADGILERAVDAIEKLAGNVGALAAAMAGTTVGQATGVKAAPAGKPVSPSDNAKSAAGAEKPASTTAKPGKSAAKGPSLDDVRSAANKFLKENGKTDENKAIIDGLCKRIGGNKVLANTKPESWEALIDAIEGYGEEDQEEEGEEEDNGSY